MHEVYLSHASLARFAAFKTRKARPRFVEYYKDLYALDHKIIDEESLMQGDQHDFAKLGRGILDSCQVDGHLNGVDTLICATWSHEFDPDYSSSGPYFSDRYHIPLVFDVCDQGSISTFMALKILLCYMRAGISKKSILLGLEQTSIPRNFYDNAVMPSFSGSSALLFSTDEGVLPRFKLICADVFPEHEVLQSQHDASALTRKKCVEIGIDANQVSLALKKSSTLFKVHEKFKHQHSALSLHTSLWEFDHAFGLLSFYYYLSALLTMKSHSTPYIAILDEDIESVSIGIVIFEVNYES